MYSNDFKLLLNSVRGKIDYISYMAGCGGEYISCTIVNNSPLYKSVSMDPEHQDASINYNRWWFHGDPFQGFWLNLAKYLKNHNISEVSIDLIVDIWDNMYSQETQHEIIADVIEYFKHNHRMLVRSHGVYNKHQELFGKESKSLTIIIGDVNWFRYIRLLISIKILLMPRYVDDGLLKDIDKAYHDFKITKTSILDYDIFINRINTLLAHCKDNNTYFNFHSVYGLINPKSISANLTTEEVLNTDVIEFNDANYFWKRNKYKQANDKLIQRIFNDHMSHRFDFYGLSDHTKYINIKDAISGCEVSDLFEIPKDVYNKAMNDWHTSNLNLINQYGITLHV